MQDSKVTVFPIAELENLLEAWEAFLEALLICLEMPAMPETEIELEVSYV